MSFARLTYYPNSMEDIQLKYQVTNYNANTTSPTVTNGNFTLHLELPFRVSRATTFTPSGSFEYAFWHCYFDEDETNGMQIEIKRAITTTPLYNADGYSTTPTFSGIAFLKKENENTKNYTANITHLTTQFTATNGSPNPTTGKFTVDLFSGNLVNYLSA
jgi:hypothetical protein